MPSDMPHTWASTAAIDESLPTLLSRLVHQRMGAPTADLCREFSPLRKLINRASAGLSFPVEAAARWRRACLICFPIATEKAARRAGVVVRIGRHGSDPLATQTATSPESSTNPDNLLESWNGYIKLYDESEIEDLCTAANLSARSLHRLFTRHLGENLRDYLGRLRIGRACMLLVETDHHQHGRVRNRIFQFIQLQPALSGSTPHDTKRISPLRRGARSHAGFTASDGSNQAFAFARTPNPETHSRPCPGSRVITF